MSDQQNRIAALLNSDPSTAAAATTAPGTGRYSVRAGQDATNQQLGIDTTPDARIFVDGHQVAAGDNGLSLDIRPDGLTYVNHGPQDATQLNGQVPVQNPVQNPAVDTGQNGGSPLGGDITQSGMTQDGTQPPASSTAPTGGDPSQSGVAQTGAPQTQTPPPDTPIEHLHGTGDHAAQADLAIFGPGTNTPAPVTHQNADGSTDITIPKGPDNPHAITVHVKPNDDDGSLDITVPKSETNPHEIKISVEPDKHVDLNITQDKDGHIKIDAHDHPPDQKGDWPGLKQPAGQGAGNSGDPNNPALPQTPKMPATPEMPGDGSAPSGGGGGVPSGGGGGIPSGGGGGIPSGGGGGGLPASGPTTPKNVPTQQTAQPGGPTVKKGSLNFDNSKINALGVKIEQGPAKTLDTASQHAAGVNIGFPGFGALGNPIQAIYSSLSDAAASELQQGSSAFTSTSQAVATTNQNYGNSAAAASTLVNDIP